MTVALDRPVNGAAGPRVGIRGNQTPLGKWTTIEYEGRVYMRQLAEHLAYDIKESNVVRLGGVTPRVADRTGLLWLYEFTLSFRGRVSLPSSVEFPDNAPGSAPSLFEALEQQLGLRLRKAADVTLDCIAIDNLDRALPIEVKP